MRKQQKPGRNLGHRRHLLQQEAKTGLQKRHTLGRIQAYQECLSHLSFELSFLRHQQAKIRCTACHDHEPHFSHLRELSIRNTRNQV